MYMRCLFLSVLLVATKVVGQEVTQKRFAMLAHFPQLRSLLAHQTGIHPPSGVTSRQLVDTPLVVSKPVVVDLEGMVLEAILIT